MATHVLNGTPVSVIYRDGSTESILIGELSLRNLYVFIKHLGASDTPALVALAAGKSPEWVDTLSDESFDALNKKALEANFPRAVARANTDPVAAAGLAPLVRVLAAAMEGVQTSGQFGSLTSPALVASASAGVSGSA